MKVIASVKNKSGVVANKEFEVFSLDTAMEEILNKLKKGETLVKIVTQLLQEVN